MPRTTPDPWTQSWHHSPSWPFKGRRGKLYSLPISIEKPPAESGRVGPCPGNFSADLQVSTAGQAMALILSYTPPSSMLVCPCHRGMQTTGGFTCCVPDISKELRTKNSRAVPREGRKNDGLRILFLSSSAFRQVVHQMACAQLLCLEIFLQIVLGKHLLGDLLCELSQPFAELTTPSSDGTCAYLPAGAAFFASMDPSQFQTSSDRPRTPNGHRKFSRSRES